MVNYTGAFSQSESGKYFECIIMGVKHVLRGSVFLLQIYMIMRDLSDPCFDLQPNNDFTSSDLAVGQEVNAFSPPKSTLKKSHPRNKRHFGLFLHASVQFVNLTRDVLLITLLLHCNDVSLNPGPPVKLFAKSRIELNKRLHYTPLVSLIVPLLVRSTLSYMKIKSPLS